MSLKSYTVETSGYFKAYCEITAGSEEEAEEIFLKILHELPNTLNLDFEQQDVEVY